MFPSTGIALYGIPATIPGDRTFSGSVTIVGNLTVNGSATIDVNQTVTGAVDITGDLTVRGGDIIAATATTWNVLNTVATTVNAFGAATTVAMGATTGTFTIANATVAVTGATAFNVTPPATFTGDVAVNGGDLTSTATTFNLLNATVTTLNIGGAATVIGLGAASTVVTLGSNATINGGAAANDDLTLQGTSHATRTTSYVVLQPNGGYVGVGRNDPGRKVEIYDSVNGYNLGITQSSAYNSGNLGGIVFNGKYTAAGDFTDMASIRGGKENTTDGDFGGIISLYTRASGGSDTERVRITSSGNAGIGTVSPDRLLHPELADAVTNVVSYPFRLTHITSGTPANSIGVGLEFEQETTADNNEIIATIEAVVTDVTATSEDADLVFRVMAAGAAAAEQFRIASDGGLFAQTLLQQSAAGLVVEWDSTGKEIYAETSALRFKDNVQDFFGAARLIELRPKSWIDKISGRSEFGLIAEEVAATVPELAVYDGNGQPIGVKYHKLSVLLLERVSRLECALLAAGIAPERVQ